VPPPRPLLLAALLASLLAAAASLAGCGMQRALVIDSDPAQAQVWVDGKHRGTAPVRVPFVHPGTFHVRLEKPGYVSTAEDVTIPSSMADYPVLDLPREVIGGSQVVRRTLKLTPLGKVPEPDELGEIRDRAREFRERTYREVAEPGTPQRREP
jgi:hypothetical protein